MHDAERHGPENRAGADVAPVVARNIRALLERRRAENRARSRADRLAEAIGRFAGSMPFVYLHLVFFGLWILINTGVLPVIPRFDPTLVALAMFASVEAIFLTTFVLITQNRMAADADRRADLDLQISLLAEHEITRLLALVRDMAHRMGVEAADDPELAALSRDVHPEGVMEQIERHQNESH